MPERQCPDCEGEGGQEVVCCEAYENGIIGGPHGCHHRGAQQGAHWEDCWYCKGAGEVEEEEEDG